MAARVLAALGEAVGGIHLRSGAGPVRDRWLEIFRLSASMKEPIPAIHPATPPARLTGGIDIAATLRAGYPVSERGLLAAADGGFVLLAMAERVEPGQAGIIAMALDTGSLTNARGVREEAAFALIALDEGIGEDEALPFTLRDRLGLCVKLDGISHREASHPVAEVTLPSRAALARVTVAEEFVSLFVQLSEAIGHRSLRKPLHLIAIARALAAIEGADAIGPEHAAMALRLGIGLSAFASTEQEAGGEEAPQPPRQDETGSEDHEPLPDADMADDPQSETPLDLEDLGEIMVAAAAAARIKLEAGFLSEQRAMKSSLTGKAGMKQDRSRRGRPIGTISAPPFPGARPDPVSTLRTAAPWQMLRRGASAPPEDAGGLAPGLKGLKILPSDFRYVRRRHRTASMAIFAVDASGSTAIDRLGEAKGAIELLLAECYVRRDQVALVAFRGYEAQVLLEPTRSLARAKRSLIALPGGGPTPLADGLRKSLEIAATARRHGQHPLIVLLTDGNANVALDRRPDRAGAWQDAEAMARRCAAESFRSVVIDIARRPRDNACLLARSMQADYRPLPHATAHSVSRIVGEYLNPPGR